ncbi:hypothetical protein AAFF_G00418880 [Aldrovandia affinis]|uniref:Uncharacterized protein n=1 Tax=Aldrovandia affinis TaxID=143900 RepID=A0AAD7SC82_9TELE|nr:hypothetical protein AAFF_G00418790 [Aldrovandia affinis]KAJ8398691.1 hypothetical protein AAFF_G00418880 [Aldrovandia affinis]
MEGSPSTDPISSSNRFPSSIGGGSLLPLGPSSSPDEALFRPGVCTQPPPVPSPGSAVSPQAPDLSGYGVSGRTDPASADGAGRPAPEVLPCPLDPHPPPPPEQAQIPEPEQEQGAGKPQPPLYRARPAGLQPGL